MTPKKWMYQREVKRESEQRFRQVLLTLNVFFRQLNERFMKLADYYHSRCSRMQQIHGNSRKTSPRKTYVKRCNWSILTWLSVNSTCESTLNVALAALTVKN